MGGRSRSSTSRTTQNNTNNIQTTNIDQSNRSVDVDGDNSIGQVAGFGNRVHIETLDGEIAESAIESAVDSAALASDVSKTAITEVTGFADNAITSVSSTLGNATTEAFNLANDVQASNSEFLGDVLEEVNESSRFATEAGINAAEAGAAQLADFAKTVHSADQLETENIKKVAIALTVVVGLVMLVVLSRGK